MWPWILAALSLAAASGVAAYLPAGWWRRRAPGMGWAEAYGHDVSVLPGGMLLHHATCACWLGERQREQLAG